MIEGRFVEIRDSDGNLITPTFREHIMAWLFDLPVRQARNGGGAIARNAQDFVETETFDMLKAEITLLLGTGRDIPKGVINAS